MDKHNCRKTNSELLESELPGILEEVERYYSGKVLNFGPTAEGVDWNGNESQIVRFNQQLKLIEHESNCSIIDYGCGYGALVELLLNLEKNIAYQGFDISPEMIACAKSKYETLEPFKFIQDEQDLLPADYLVSSGIMSVSLSTDKSIWEEYALSLLHKFDTLANKGFAFNMLTSYSDPEYMRSNLYYAEPEKIFSYCKRHFSRNVALLHDYNLYEFTILVRKL